MPLRRLQPRPGARLRDSGGAGGRVAVRRAVGELQQAPARDRGARSSAATHRHAGRAGGRSRFANGSAAASNLDSPPTERIRTGLRFLRPLSRTSLGGPMSAPTATTVGLLGRLPVRRDVRTLALARYVDRAELPRRRRHLDLTKRVPDWPMYANDRLGDCTCAAAGHMIEAWTAAAGQRRRGLRARGGRRLRAGEDRRPGYRRGRSRRARRAQVLAQEGDRPPPDRGVRIGLGARPRAAPHGRVPLRRPLHRPLAAADRAAAGRLGLDGLAHRAGSARLMGRPRRRRRRLLGNGCRGRHLGRASRR